VYKSFDELIQKANQLSPKRTIVISAADDGDMIHLVEEILKISLCKVILVGNKDKIEELAAGKFTLADVRIVDVKDRIDSCLTAVKLVHDGAGQVLVKGKVNTSDFLRAVLNKEVGLRSGKKLNVLSCYDVPDQEKLFFISDGGMIVAPTLEDKVDILENCIPVLHRMGITQPKVAILSANEVVSESMPSTVDAAALCRMAREGMLPKAIYEGPISLDVAVSPAAAKAKGIKSQISGDVDLFLVPSIETGNCMGKAIGYFAHGNMAGLVLGATHPVIMASRSAPIKNKLTSIAWAILASQNIDIK